MNRVLTPELLDELPPEEPRAIQSRKDLQRINAWMGNATHVARQLRDRITTPPRTLLELGCGDGTFLLKFARQLSSKWSDVQVTLLDQQNIVRPETVQNLDRLGWTATVVTADLRHWLPAQAPGSYDLVVANLVLHHFTDGELRDLFASLARTSNAFVACDPRRWIPALVSTRFLWVIGCNDVTRHDARVSVEAGFRDQELTPLWPAGNDFRLLETPAGFSSHLFFAERTTAG